MDAFLRWSHSGPRFARGDGGEGLVPDTRVGAAFIDNLRAIREAPSFVIIEGWSFRRMECHNQSSLRSNRRLRLTLQGLTDRDRADENQQSVGDNITENGPPPVRELSTPKLKALIESGTPFELVDVRTDEEREFAKIDGSRLLDQSYHDALRSLDPNTPIVFQCHYGVRSRQAAEYFRHLGFRNLYNLRGGIDAWSQFVDPSVLRY